MIPGLKTLLSGLIATGATLAPALAQQAASLPSFATELRLGGMEHDYWSAERSGIDPTAEVLLNLWRTPDSPFYIPRLHFGTTLSLHGKTSLLYSGVTWDVPVFGPLYAEASFGGAANNGHAGSDPDPGHNMLGCNVMFRESAGVGAHLDAHWSVTGLVEHTSNANLCRFNRGVTNYGLKVGYLF